MRPGLSRLLDALARDVDRMRAVAVDKADAPVPTCPEWTVSDLLRHVADLYQNVVVRRFRMPGDPPRQDLAAEDPIGALERCYAAMTAEFAGRDPGERVGHEPHETVRFWIRRMTHETAIHRVDAELAAGVAVTPIPRDLAVDGLDEMLTEFLEPVTRLFPDEFADELRDWAGRHVVVTAGDAAWWVTVRPDGAEVTPWRGGNPRVPPPPAPPDGTGPASRPGPVTVRAEPDVLLRWLYNRDSGAGVTIDGDDELVVRLRRLLTAVTNTA